jgi:predicted amidohydrolase
MKTKISLLQLCSTESVKDNLKQILDLASSSNCENSEILFLPENCLYFRIGKNSTPPDFSLMSPEIQILCEWSLSHKKTLHLGSVPWREGSTKPRSCSVTIAQGKVIPGYCKMHLFDVDIPGLKPIRESDAFDPGHFPNVIKMGSWSFGETICYDLRFSNLFASYALNEVDAVLVPAAFLPETGRAHWHTLLRARAIESQCFVIAAAQCGEHKLVGHDSRFTYGHSIVVDPWGQILGELDGSKSPTVLTVELDAELLTKVRRQIPMSLHRRTIS